MMYILVRRKHLRVVFGAYNYEFFPDYSVRIYSESAPTLILPCIRARYTIRGALGACTPTSIGTTPSFNSPEGITLD